MARLLEAKLGLSRLVGSDRLVQSPTAKLWLSLIILNG